MGSLDDIRLFVRLAGSDSLSDLSRRTGAPKSSISRALTRLEASVGQCLVERSTRHLRLTSAGRLFLLHAARIIGEVDDAREAIGRMRGNVNGTLRINAPVGVARGFIAPMLPAFFARYPAVRLILDADNRRIDLLSNATDLVVRVGPLEDSGLVGRKIASIEIWLCSSPAYLARSGAPTSLESLARLQLITHRERPKTWEIKLPSGEMRSFKFEACSVIPEPSILQTVLVASGGIGLLPDFLAGPSIAAGELVRVLPDFTMETVELHGLYSSHRGLTSKVRHFLDALIAHAADSPPERSI